MLSFNFNLAALLLLFIPAVISGTDERGFEIYPDGYQVFIFGASDIQDVAVFKGQVWPDKDDEEELRRSSFNPNLDTKLCHNPEVDDPATCEKESFGQFGYIKIDVEKETTRKITITIPNKRVSTCDVTVPKEPGGYVGWIVDKGFVQQNGGGKPSIVCVHVNLEASVASTSTDEAPRQTVHPDDVMNAV